MIPAQKSAKTAEKSPKKAAEAPKPAQKYPKSTAAEAANISPITRGAFPCVF